MKAWVLHGINDLRFEDIPKPVPGPGEALVKVRCAGICSSDIRRIFSAGAYSYPIVLGHEFSGETEDGRRVSAFPLLPCFKCESCELGHYETCSNYGYIGSRRNGAFAEYVAVPEWNLVEIPCDMSFEAAALLEPAAVALHAAKRLDLHGVRNAAVIGNGVIGRLIAKWLEIYGVANVELLGRNDRQGFARYDACVDAVGSEEALAHCIEAVRPGGQIVLAGNPDADFCLGQKLHWQILRKQIALRGSWNARYPSDWQRVIEHAGKLWLDGLISDRCPLGKLGKAADMVRNRKSGKYCKVVAVA